jgi:hypothetical protein
MAAVPVEEAMAAAPVEEAMADLDPSILSAEERQKSLDDLHTLLKAWQDECLTYQSQSASTISALTGSRTPFERRVDDVKTFSKTYATPLHALPYL